MDRRTFEIAMVAALSLAIGVNVGEIRARHQTGILKVEGIRTQGIELVDAGGRACGGLFIDRFGDPCLTLKRSSYPGMISMSAGGRSKGAQLIVGSGVHRSAAIVSSDDTSARFLMLAGSHGGPLDTLSVNSDGSTSFDMHPGSGPRSSSILTVNGVALGHGGPAAAGDHSVAK